MPWRACLSLGIGLMALCTAAAAAEKFILEPMPRRAGGFRVMGNVQSADAKVWPATFKFSVGPNCTATAVGPRVLITAAHCLPGTLTSGSLKDPSIDPQNPVYVDIVCAKHPDYVDDAHSPSTVFDVALCLASKPQTARTEAQIVLPPNKPYERIAVQNAELNASDFTLIGFGCHQLYGSSGDDLWKGTASRGDGADPSGYLAVKGDSWLCEGDSGGAAYFEKAPQRSIVALNSRVNSDSHLSLLAPMNDARIVAFMKSWVADRKREGEVNLGICGLDSTLPRSMCHS